MIYLDSHATTPVDPKVLAAMLPFFTEHFGNASSRNHPFGWTAAKAVETARAQVGALIGARFRDFYASAGIDIFDRTAFLWGSAWDASPWWRAYLGGSAPNAWPRWRRASRWTRCRASSCRSTPTCARA